MNDLNPRNYGRSLRVLGGYALLVTTFHAVFGAFLVMTKRRSLKLPERVQVADVLLLATATYKLSRVITKDSVTSFIRAPFAVYRGAQGSSELKEDVRGSGVQKAIGELLTCPFCLGTWIAAALSYGLVLDARVTRLFAALFTISTISDAFQYGFEVLKKSAEGPSSGDEEQESGATPQALKQA